MWNALKRRLKTIKRIGFKCIEITIGFETCPNSHFSMSNADENGVASPNVLKRKKEDCAEEQLEAEIKRVALDDDTETVTAGLTNGTCLENGLSNGNGQDSCSSDGRELSSESISRHAHLRMLCLVKEASIVVGHKGETICKIKSETSTRINVSDNVRGVPERVIYVRGSCDNVAKAFGMIVRSLVSRNEESDLDENSTATTINLLISHHLMGCVIGKHGSRLREIEDLSAARLSASPQQLLMSNDRILSITGVADAIHIATFYVGQTIMNSREGTRMKKPIFYQPSAMYSALLSGISPPGFSHQKHHQYHPTDKYTTNRGNKRVSRSSSLMMVVPANQSFPRQVSEQPLSRIPVTYTAANAANATSFTPNFMIPNVRILDGPVTTPAAQTMSIVEQKIYIDENFVGNIIGRDGKHINSIKEATGCSIFIDEPVNGASERRLTVKGTSMGSQAAIMLISNKIEIDRINRERKR
ncbi:hypothetical protein HG535_0B03070 [Zygotorulaspora mrakii]|uniref:K Homology domain-containing protein n=1 Tax=Zygotorulaspora mrakii TaxID=42260 RepID=A0A7H9AXX5_ZYGMR|nr:uncharacterized protein HG535_0B03070 [Zygotorulaspora mrakii]QLG71268.1 hypothetical protein HG535_0B03070 [Zygotorulaspora mrakii]